MDAPVLAQTRLRRRHAAVGLTGEPVCDVLLFGMLLRGDSNVSNATRSAISSPSAR